MTPPHLAAERGRTHIVQLLITHNANPNLVSNNGMTALDFAQDGGFQEIANILRGKIGLWGAVRSTASSLINFFSFGNGKNNKKR